MPVEAPEMKPCKRGHTSPRRASNRTCIECERERNATLLKDPTKQRKYQTSYYERNVEALRSKSRERMRLLREDNPESIKETKKQERIKRIAAQEEAAGRRKPKHCEVCGRSKRISFDHCHATGEFRGWLCMPCNLTLGMVQDNPDILKRLADYLEQSKGTEYACIGEPEA